MGNSAAVYNGHAQVIDELLGNEQVRIPDGIEDLADRQRRGRMLADEPVRLLQLAGNRVFHPEKMIRFEALSQPRRLDRRQPVMNVVEQVKILSILHAKSFKQFWKVVQILH